MNKIKLSLNKLIPVLKKIRKYLILRFTLLVFTDLKLV